MLAGAWLVGIPWMLLPLAFPDARHVHLVPAEHVKLVIIKHTGSVVQDIRKFLGHWPEKINRFLKSITIHFAPRLCLVYFFQIKMTSGSKVTLAWLGPVYLEQGTNGPPECCWWRSQSCSRIPVGRPARSRRPNQAAGPWWRIAKNPPLPRSTNTPHPVVFRREGRIWFSFFGMPSSSNFKNPFFN